MQSLPYDRSRLTPGIVHIGVGNFHRAHMAVYLDDLFSLGDGHDWAILGAGVRPADARMREVMAARDNLSTVIELDPAGNRARTVAAMTGFLPVEAGHGALIAAMSEPRIRIVSLTVTEGGYFIDAGGGFDADHPDIRADVAAPDRPVTAFGAILAALARRRAAGVAPFTVLSCDNLPHNGAVTRNTVAGLAALMAPEFGEWVRANVAFPNGMVDRITPATGPREIALAHGMGLDDPAPVTCEPFRQWVLEDTFPAGRPALEKVGVTFTADVAPYESMKLRILNGGHAIIAYPAALMDIELVHEAMADPLIAAFLDRVERIEVLPHVRAVPEITPEAYYEQAADRFANPMIADTTRRLALDGSNRQPKFILPSLRDTLAAGGTGDGLLLVSALWCRYCAGVTDGGTPIAPNDPNWAALNDAALRAKDTPAAWLQQSAIYGDLAQTPAVVDRFARHLKALDDNGTRATLARYLGG